jgi:putative tricarboxylic transport membrane protein
MRGRNLVTAIVLLIFSIVILLETGKLPIGNLRSSQAGFFPLVLAILLGILSLILLIQTIMGKIEEKKEPWVNTRGWKDLGLTVSALFVFGAFFERFGYLVSTFLLIFFLMKFVGRTKWLNGIVFALLSTIFSYLLFEILLKTQLPAGLLKGVLPD